MSASGARAGRSGIYERRWLEAQLWETMSKVRAAHGLPGLRPNGKLMAAAQQHTIEMAQDGYFDHNGVRVRFSRRMAEYYPRARRHVWRVGEILAWGAPSISAGQALTLWLHSREHRATLLSRWRDVGISAMHSRGAPGVFQGLDVTVITIDFGSR
jgi:uncharacterized protein YkwD